ncbi:cytochrome c maturation protein CcmE [Pelagibacterium nitratireducens]|jgi:cytochrome c-type biogenesis protein CcmE|uniref:Cytochrome c-type biogenesis protein CcmE n=1 Tax=Pelagibacterium nitratireducens TaxID=1046114 RepID=A0ABZ2HX36_9HYPH|tara:strand:+ start:9141 stop:9584 length:444 start_codon:yes stop_codon:yes gene_type:complete
MAWTRKQKRLGVIAGLGVVLALAAGLILTALRDQIVFFYSPTEIAEAGISPGTPIRLGGLVLEDSWQQDGENNVFVVHDGAGEMTARYTGILPDLFREGQGVVAEGSVQPDGTFLATNVLAKHDETYMPREVADSLRAQGVWQGEEG